MPTQSLFDEQQRAEAAERGRAAFNHLVDAVPIEKLVADLATLADYNRAVMDRYPSTRPL